MTGRRLRALARLRRLHAVRRVARDCGRLDARGELGSFGTAALRGARRAAFAAGCIGTDVDEMTVCGLDWGRADVSNSGCREAAQGTEGVAQEPQPRQETP